LFPHFWISSKAWIAFDFSIAIVDRIVERFGDDAGLHVFTDEWALGVAASVLVFRKAMADFMMFTHKLLHKGLEVIGIDNLAIWHQR